MKFQITDTPDAVAVLVEQIENHLADASLPFAAVNAAMLCVEELVSNILKHGRIEGERPDIEVELRLEDAQMIIDISDNTMPFDPTATCTPSHIDAPLEERPIGGLGIHLVQKLADQMSYRRVNGRNHLRLIKRLPST